MTGKIILNSLKLLSHLPLTLVQLLGIFVGWGFYLVPNQLQRNARINIALCFPKMSGFEQKQLLRKALIENAKTLLEMPGVWFGDPNEWLARVKPGDGINLPRESLDRDKGLIIAAPHLGMWEAGVHYLARISPVTVLYRPPREQALEEVIKSGRGRGGARLVPTDAQGVRMLYQALRKGEMVAILPDQEPKAGGRSAGVFAPFFGQPARTMVLLGRLARKTGAAVVYTYVERLSLGRGYRMHFLPASDAVSHADPAVAAAALNEGIENCVCRCPDQYQWTYKRFNAQPDGGRSPYK